MRPTLSSTTESKIINDRETKRSKNFGFITFNNEKAMKDAIEGINGQNLNGRNITINKAQSRVAANNGFLGRVSTSTIPYGENLFLDRVFDLFDKKKMVSLNLMSLFMHSMSSIHMPIQMIKLILHLGSMV
ncbi:hypothetical protein Pyn_00333 [Prunus yedoensis var. nudiflora]|uniref:RRM domain-containing protein n=1 Tax=Prunus yedoensis var. nudiflora TaxID=2094558 RepID=A0A314Y126_PRUYE|nr:hypothetical protein Pyn_00333 [Prunus yedoensis var. nudiflora]